MNADHERDTFLHYGIQSKFVEICTEQCSSNATHNAAHNAPECQPHYGEHFIILQNSVYMAAVAIGRVDRPHRVWAAQNAQTRHTQKQTIVLHRGKEKYSNMADIRADIGGWNDLSVRDETFARNVNRRDRIPTGATHAHTHRHTQTHNAS